MNDRYWILVKEKLKELGLTQTGLARSLGIEVRTFQDWVYSKKMPDTETSVKIANALGVTVDYLVTGERTDTEPLSEEDKNYLAAFHKIAPDHRPLAQKIVEQIATDEVSRLQVTPPTKND